MPLNPSEAGPYSIGPDSDLAPGGRIVLLLTEAKVAGKKGYLKKLFGSKGGMDYAFVTNSSGYMVKVETSAGSGQTPVPSATSVNFDGTVTSVTLTNDTASTIAASDLDVSVGNNVRKSGGNSFSGSQLLSDVIPGVSNG